MLRSALLLLILTSCLPAQPRFEYWPGASYDPAIPTLRKVAGYEIGDRISSHADVVHYLEVLAAAEPRRMKLFEYGKTWEGRKLVYAVIGSEANIARLTAIKDGIARLSDPRKTTDAAAQTAITSLPVLVWLAYGVHGNEISSTDAGLRTAYHLLAARNDKMVATILSRELVIIDPMQNPDGRERFIHSFEQGEGLEPDPNPLAAEHSEPWPGGRTNHYFFDMNRDWVAMTQPETKGRIAAMLEWRPQVVVDLHEMGTDAGYYFAPPADPFNPNMTKFQRDYQNDIGKGNAKYFDQFGFSYFTRDTYDAWYPGYGDSWPVYFGAIAMTYENGSTRGLVVKRSNDQTVTYRDTVRRHFVASLATCETSANRHDDLLTNFYQYGKTGVEEGSTGTVREYILPRRGNTSGVDKLAQLMLEQGVEVNRASADFTQDGKAYPAGSYIVPLAQPAKRRVKNLLDLDTQMDTKFLKSEEDRRKRRLSSQIYDVTAWSVPLQFNVEAVPAGLSEVATTPVNFGEVKSVGISGGKAVVAYLVPWGTSASARVMTGALRANLRLYGADKSFIQNGREYPAGTLVIPVKENPDTVHDIVARLATANSAEIVSTATSWVDDGPNFGSRYTPYIKKPAIALAWDRPTSGNSAGQTRFVLERQFGYPVTAVRTQQLTGSELSQFQVLILPEPGGGEGSYADVLGAAGIARLKQWVADGGTIIGIGSAVQFLADARMGLLPIQQENRVPETPAATTPPATGGGGRGGPAVPAAPDAPPARPAGKAYARDTDFDKAIQPDTELPTSLRGALVRCHVDKEQWIAAGVPETVYAMVSGSSIYTPIKIDRGVNAATFSGPDDVLASGYMWEEYRKQLAYKPFVVVARSGRGVVIGFTADPNYRAAIDGLNILFLNAVFRGPAHASGGGRGGEESH
jgi:hypothetical protein